MASLVGDALALGVHWEYDPNHILKTHGRVNTFVEPELGSYHSGKKVGDLTHLGDQTLALLDSVAQKGGFDLNDFCGRWQSLFTSYRGYVDKATRQTLSNLSDGAAADSAGSESMELAGPARIAPLFCALSQAPEDLLQAVQQQTAMTHNHPAALSAARFIALTVLETLQGSEPVAAMQKAAKADYGSAPVQHWVDSGLSTVDMKTVTAITRLGASCNTANALPGVVHLVAKYPDDLSTCLVECVMAGGDSATRAMVAGMILGAHLGMGSIPDIWLNGLNAKPRIMDALNRF